MATSIAAMFARHVRAVHADDTVEAMQRVFGFTERPNLPPRYNIAPRQEVPIVRRTRDGAGRELILIRWGLVPYWPTMSRLATGRSMPGLERASARPAFREAYRRRRRCLVPADGFFEWRKQGKRRQPLLLRRKDGSPFAFVGLWERWKQLHGQALLWPEEF
jgi:putative SOS response-associated peptidase YedK